MLLAALMYMLVRSNLCASIMLPLVQGQVELQRQEQLLSKALDWTITVQLGGAYGAAQGWGRALAVHLESSQPDLVKLRSELGNRLADASAAAGLVPMGVVAYVEVRLCCAGACANVPVAGHPG